MSKLYLPHAQYLNTYGGLIRDFVRLLGPLMMETTPPPPPRIDAQGKTFNVFLADCPWTYRNMGGANPVEGIPPYPVLTQAQLEKMVLPIAPDLSILFLWATMPHLPDAVRVLEAWGFTYTTAWTWSKRNADGTVYKGVGYWGRSSAELLLIGTRGAHPFAQVQNHNMPGLFEAIPIGHSAKPPEVHRYIRTLFGSNADHLGFLELFARPPLDAADLAGWHVWGNEIPGCPAILDVGITLTAAAALDHGGGGE